MADKILKEKLNAIESIDDDESDRSSIAAACTMRTRDRLTEISRRGDLRPTSTGTRERLALIEGELAAKRTAIPATSTGRRERLGMAAAELARRTAIRPTSSVTRERLVNAEAELAKRNVFPTSTGTRERLALAEAQLAKKNTAIVRPTSTGTRERLAIVEAELGRRTAVRPTSTGTREKLRFAEEELKRLELEEKTSTKMREDLSRMNKEIERKRKDMISSETRADFERRQAILEDLIDENSKLDLAFMMDCTGSMGSYISQTKSDIFNIVDDIKAKYENEIQLGFVGYRDHCDGIKRIEKLDFTEDVDHFKDFVGSLAATGGGDAPEDVLGGLEAIFTLGWSNPSRVVVHIGDAPQHGGMFHDLDSNSDDYYFEEPRGLDVHELFKTLRQLKIMYYFGRLNSSTDKMIDVFRQIGQENVKVEDVHDPSFIKPMVLKSVSNTIDIGTFSLVETMKSKRVTKKAGGGLEAITEISEGGKTLKEYSIIEEEPDSSSMEEFDAHNLVCSFLDFFDNLKEVKKHIGAIDHKWNKVHVKMAKDPFSQGEQRISYHGIVGSNKVVLKEFKHYGKGRDRREDYIELMETQAIAEFMASRFNKVAPPGAKKIEFLNVSYKLVSRY